VDSFETDLDVTGIGEMHAVFIRAPWVEEVGPDVEILASHRDHPVVLREGNVTLASFHPELSGDDRLHRIAFGL
jgi:5'-phosphate synthase pdxT subunit